MKPGIWMENRDNATGTQIPGVEEMNRILITKTGWLTLATVLACLTLTVGASLAVPTFTSTGTNFPWGMSADGSVVVGNTGDGNYEAFRWTELTGAVGLGMHTGNIPAGGGVPDISDDGLHVSATIITADSTLATQGIWTKGIGWQRSMPPIPPSGGAVDTGLGSCWGLSGDGTTLTGFFWRSGATDGTAHANTWSRVDSTFTHLPTPVRNCRGNDLNYDGSIVVGWSETDFGTWQPTVWENGGVEVLSSSEYWTEAKGITNDGNIICGKAYDALSGQVSAAIWLRTETGWQENLLGVLPGTFIGYGQAIMYEMAETAPIGVGYNEFTWGSGTGFVWTLNEGMVSAMDFFTSYGVTFPPNFVIDSVTGISHDGMKFCGFGHDSTIYPGVPEGFVVSLDYLSSVPDVASVRGMTFEPNFPNPFNPTTTIALSLDRAQNVRLDIYDARGRLVRALHDGSLAAGRNELQWDGRDNSGRQASSGVYFSRASGEHGETRSQRMMLVK
ncbi:MAG: hypothetical protein DRR04_12470 [Gammaproteobacteria bacterium]|nr:MAG: hypothetical protein DRR04_12470 [Gammaproteobacteria bacterium]